MPKDFARRRREIFEILGSLTTISYCKIERKSANTAPESAKFSPAARYNPSYPTALLKVLRVKLRFTVLDYGFLKEVQKKYENLQKHVSVAVLPIWSPGIDF